MDERAELAHEIATAIEGSGRTVAAAESVTAGNIATALASAPDASEWFSGSVVAYRTATKRAVLRVGAAAIISHECAREMAEGALALTSADIVVSVTGVGGPDPEEGRPAGTVVICAGTSGRLRTFDHDFEGPPEQVVELATLQALRHLLDAARTKETTT